MPPAQLLHGVSPESPRGHTEVVPRERPSEGLHGPDLFEACLRGIQQGSRSAMERLVIELTPLVWNVARGHGLDRHSAEDVVQSVWLTLFSRVKGIREPRALAGWLITTARREAQQMNGRKTPPVPLTDEIAERIDDPGRAPESEVLLQERNDQIWNAFARLSERDQELLRLTVLGRVGYGEVARELGLSVSSVGALRHRALRKMRTLLDEEPHLDQKGSDVPRQRRERTAQPRSLTSVRSHSPALSPDTR